jgi:hypothetical protein
MFSTSYARIADPIIPVNRPANRPKLKSGLSPTDVLRQSWHYDTTVFIANYTPPLWKTQTSLGYTTRRPGMFREYAGTVWRLS